MFHNSISSPVLDDDFAHTVVAFRDDAFKIGLFERVVLHFDCQALVGRIERRAFGQGPGLQDSIHFYTEVRSEERRVGKECRL